VHRENCAMFEVLKAVMMLKFEVFWKMTLCCGASGF
jgi:hypothetical protein